MQNAKQTISKLLVAVADALNSMDDREFDLLIHGEVNFASCHDPRMGATRS